jgi:coenzyme F420-dependent glucose-6-phosphate dehydrogenase
MVRSRDRPIAASLRTDDSLISSSESATKTVTEEHVAKAIVCGPDPDRHLDLIKRYVHAGYDHVTIHQVGPHQRKFLRFFESELRPRL